MAKLTNIRDEIERLTILGRSPGADKEGIKKQIADILIGLKSGTKDERKMYSDYEKQYGGGGGRPYNQNNPLSMAGNLLTAMNSSMTSKGVSDSIFQSAVTKFDAAVTKFSGQTGPKAVTKDYGDISVNKWNPLTWHKTSNMANLIKGEGLKKDDIFTYQGKKYKVKGTSGVPEFTELKATGGYISGPGTSTSDSIPAMLSNGEYVINADSVKKYGVQTFNAFNSKKYSMGGPVTRMPYANGGLATSGSSMYNINVTLNGSNLDANDVARAIHREMKMREITAGRSRTV